MTCLFLTWKERCTHGNTRRNIPPADQGGHQAGHDARVTPVTLRPVPFVEPGLAAGHASSKPNDGLRYDGEAPLAEPQLSGDVEIGDEANPRDRANLPSTESASRTSPSRFHLATSDSTSVSVAGDSWQELSSFGGPGSFSLLGSRSVGSTATSHTHRRAQQPGRAAASSGTGSDFDSRTDLESSVSQHVPQRRAGSEVPEVSDADRIASQSIVADDSAGREAAAVATESRHHVEVGEGGVARPSSIMPGGSTRQADLTAEDAAAIEAIIEQDQLDRDTRNVLAGSARISSDEPLKWVHKTKADKPVAQKSSTKEEDVREHQQQGKQGNKSRSPRSGNSPRDIASESAADMKKLNRKLARKIEEHQSRPPTPPSPARAQTPPKQTTPAPWAMPPIVGSVLPRPSPGVMPNWPGGQATGSGAVVEYVQEYRPEGEQGHLRAEAAPFVPEDPAALHDLLAD